MIDLKNEKVRFDLIAYQCWSVGILFHTSTVLAQTNYPNKPIMFIVPYGAGGGADARSRQIAQKMSALLKQPIVVENKPGAGGNIGTEMIARAAPDGYTIGMGNFAPLAVFINVSEFLALSNLSNSVCNWL